MLIKFACMFKVEVFFFCYIVRDEREIYAAPPSECIWLISWDGFTQGLVFFIRFLMLGPFRGTIRLAQPFLSCQMLKRSPVKVSTHTVRDICDLPQVYYYQQSKLGVKVLQIAALFIIYEKSLPIVQCYKYKYINNLHKRLFKSLGFNVELRSLT